jgi:hypothetical protein
MLLLVVLLIYIFSPPVLSVHEDVTPRSESASPASYVLNMPSLSSGVNMPDPNNNNKQQQQQQQQQINNK